MTQNNFSATLLMTSLMSFSWLYSLPCQAVTLGSALRVDLSAVNRQAASSVLMNQITVDGRSYFLPDSIHLKMLPSGQFQLDRIDQLGHKVGNGGDYLRSTFIKMGQKVIEFLTTTEAGAQLVSQNKLSLDDLSNALDINRIVVTNDILFDNTGSVVDAIGVPGLILLSSTAWLDHFENERSVYDLIFHEMLRSVAINDDNYTISAALHQFPSSLSISTRLIPLVPLIDEDSLQSLFDLSSVQVNGTGCVKNSGQFFAELDLARNALQLTFNRYVATNSTEKLVDYASCSLAIPVKLPAGKKLTISLIDLQGQVVPRASDLTSAVNVKFEAFLAGSRSRTNMKTINLKQDDRSFLFRKTDVLSSGCGTNDIVRVNTSQILRSQAQATNEAGKPNQTADLSVNSTQIKKISLFMNLEDCQ